MEQWAELYTRTIVQHHQYASLDPVEEEPTVYSVSPSATPLSFSPPSEYYMAEAPMDETENEVTQFLREIKKEKWIYKFLENDITDLQTLRELKPEEWRLLELPIGARNAIEREVNLRVVAVTPDAPQKSTPQNARSHRTLPRILAHAPHRLHLVSVF